VLFKNDLHVFYHSCPNKNSPRPSPEVTKRLFVSGFGFFKGMYLESIYLSMTEFNIQQEKKKLEGFYPYP